MRTTETTDPLDLPLDHPRHPPLLETVRWWERMRLWYNLMVGLVGLIAVSNLWEEMYHLELLMGVLFYGILANAAYTAGWVADVLVRFYSKGRFSLHGYRVVFFLFGLLFSLGLTYFLSISLTIAHLF